MSTGRPLGIDVGGSGIKGAPVDLEKGEFAQDRFKIETPEHATPEAVCDVIAEIVDRFDEVHDGSPIGVTIPGVVQHGVVKTAEIHDNAIARDVKETLRKLQAAQYVANNPGQVCPAKWQEGAATLTPSLDLVGKI